MFEFPCLTHLAAQSSIDQISNLPLKTKDVTGVLVVVWCRYCYDLPHLGQIALGYQTVQDVRHNRDLGDHGQVRWSRLVKGIPSDETLVFLIWPNTAEICTMAESRECFAQGFIGPDLRQPDVDQCVGDI